MVIRVASGMLCCLKTCLAALQKAERALENLVRISGSKLPLASIIPPRWRYLGTSGKRTVVSSSSIGKVAFVTAKSLLRMETAPGPLGETTAAVLVSPIDTFMPYFGSFCSRTYAISASRFSICAACSNSARIAKSSAQVTWNMGNARSVAVLL